VGRRSPHSLFSQDLATFGEDHVYRQADATGFIRLFGLSLKVRGQVEKKLRGGAHAAKQRKSKI
jgi:argininosuccinate synthase